jgi:hypothetical protein
MRALTSALALAAAAFTCSAAHAQLTPSEERGRATYFGEPGSALDEAMAVIPGAGSASLPGKSFPCSSCHGPRGEGRTERGVTPANLDRTMLEKSYGLAGQGGRIRPPYTLDSFLSALASGHDPAGRELATAMPRYVMDEAAATDLWAFLAKVGSMQDPGLSDTTIRLGAVLTLTGPMAEEGRQMRRILDTVFDATNQSGGIYGRKISLVLQDAAVAGPARDDVFAWIIVAAPASTTAFGAGGAPVLAPWELRGTPEDGVFALTATERDQALALSAFAAEQLKTSNVAACKTSGAIRLIDTACTGDLTGRPSRALLTLPAFNALAAQQRATLPADTWVAVPIDFSQINPTTQKTFGRIHGRISSTTMLAQAHAYSSAALTIELLKRLGRRIDRETFITELTNLKQFVGGMSPPLSFSTTRNVGSTGALVVRYDKTRDALEASGVWVDR